MPTRSRFFAQDRSLFVRCLKSAAWLTLFICGCWVLFRLALRPFGGHLEDVWVYQSRETHRFTAMSMLTGSLRYHYSLVSLVGDEEVYNGAGYTHWGYGVPLLQLPFHAVARHMASLPAKFFPDRAIFFVYVALLVPTLWLAMDRLVATRAIVPPNARFRALALSWAVTAFILCTGLYPLLTGHFHVYDETIAYFVVVELAAISAYAMLTRSSGWAPVVALAASAGIGLLTRPTGAVMLGVWTAIVMLERPSRRTAVVFLGSVAPFVTFWLVSNWIRTGYPWSMGFQNSLPGADHIGHVRFGSLCINNWDDTKMVARAILRSLFVVPENLPWMHTCGLRFEGRSGSDAGNDPYLGVGVEIFLVWTFLHYVSRRERRLAVYVPFAAIAFVFVSYVNAGAGMAWRYVGDFWPLVFLIGVQYARTLPFTATSTLGLPLAAALLASAYTTYKREIAPAEKQFDAFDASAASHMWQDFEKTRTGQDKVMPTTLRCGALPDWPHFNAWWRSNVIAWNPDCTVATVTEFFIGVPPKKKNDSYVFSLKTEGMSRPSILVWVNGHRYAARRIGDTYQTDVGIHYPSLSTPTIFVSIEWQHDLFPVPGKLDEASIQ